MPKRKILISACLLDGGPWRYDGRVKTLDGLILEKLEEIFELVPICPEVAGGLPVPRTPAERIGNRVVNAAGEEVTQAYKKGAGEALKLAKSEDIRAAILKEKSPSCGTKFIYDGSFSKKLIPGKGVAGEALSEEGITVFNEDEIEEAIMYMASMEEEK